MDCLKPAILDLPLKIGLSQIVKYKRPLLLTSPGWLARGIVEIVRAHLGRGASTGCIGVNPRIRDVILLEKTLPYFDYVLAIGGGSVIDAAKAVVALRALDGNAEEFQSAVLGNSALPTALNCVPILAVPTTSGTGSEVNSQATLWGGAMEKYSLAHPAILPEAALFDPSLCVDMPREVTLFGALDALSHAMEAIWNRSNSIESDCAAIDAISRIRIVLPKVLHHPSSITLRREMQMAALSAGLAMAKTQTALAHSISYPLTKVYGIPHGLAASLTLGEIAKFNAELFDARISLIAAAFSCELADLTPELHKWMIEIGVPYYLEVYMGSQVTVNLSGDLIASARSRNNLRIASANDAKAILHRSLAALRLNKSGN